MTPVQPWGTGVPTNRKQPSLATSGVWRRVFPWLLRSMGVKPTPWDVLFRQPATCLLPAICLRCQNLLAAQTRGGGGILPELHTKHQIVKLFVVNAPPTPTTHPTRFKSLNVPIWLLKRWGLNLRLEHFPSQTGAAWFSAIGQIIAATPLWCESQL